MFRALTAAAFLALSATAAQADSTTQVPFGDLNLSRPQDVAMLADRLQTAAKMVCLNTIGPKAGRVVMRDCVDTAVSAATAQIEDRIEQHALSAIRANLVNVRQRVSNADDFGR